MTIRSCLVFALIAGIVGAFLGRALSRDAPGVQAAPNASSALSATAPARRGCRAERADLASTKRQLAICMTSGTRVPETETPGDPELSEPDRPETESIDPRLPSAKDRQAYRQFMDSDSGTVLVRHFDGTIGVYNPDEWPIDGDGTIIARKLPSEKIGWYAGPDAGPRSDPAAFLPWDPVVGPLPAWGREPDGTITIGGKPAPTSVQFMFGGKGDEPAKPVQRDAP